MAESGSAKKLDRSKPFSEIWGNPPAPGAKYSQGGQLFNANGDLCQRFGVKNPKPETDTKLPPKGWEKAWTKQEMINYYNRTFKIELSQSHSKAQIANIIKERLST